MEFRLLGEVVALSHDQPLALGRRQERLLLGILLLEPNRPVSVDRLIELLWPADQPANPRRAIQVYFSRLRRVLAKAGEDDGPVLLRQDDGYLVRTPAESIDVHCFTQQIRAARTIADPAARAAALRSALDLYRGEPLESLASQSVLRQLGGPFDEAYRTALELRIDAALEAGLYDDLRAEVPVLIGRYPVAERPVAALMRALHHDARPAEALTVYEELTARLRERLGLEPGPELRALADSIRQNALGSPTPIPQPPEPARTGPRQLPADVRFLVDRDLLLAHGQLHLTTRRPAAFCLHGGAGVGKSAAAVRLGHRVAADFTDGQLFLRLLEPDGTALPSRTALARLLRAIGVPPSEIPESLEARIAVLTEKAADREFLLVLDDAQDLAQVSPLLRLGPRCSVIITSRQALSGLEHAEHHQVRPLGDDASLQLLRHVAQAEFDGGEMGDLVTIVERCAGLPLALRVVGSRLSPVAGQTVPAMVAALEDAAQRLDVLEIGDLAVRASLELSLAAVEPLTCALLERVVQLGIDEFSAWVAAPLLDVDESVADREVERLYDLGLVHLRTESPRRFGVHGLVRAYTLERSSDAGAIEAATRRYVGALVRLATIADEELDHGFVQTEGLSTPEPPSLPGVEASARSMPGEWFGLEAPAICTLIAKAPPEQAALLALRVRGYLTLQDESEQAGSALETALGKLNDGSHPGLEGRLLQAYFTTVAQHHRPVGELIALADRSLRLARLDDSTLLEMSAYWQFGYSMIEACDFEAAAMAYESALVLIEKDPALGHHRAKALSGAGDAARLNGDLERAAVILAEAASLDPGRTRWRAVTLYDLATALVEGGRLTEAEPVIREAEAIFAELGDSFGRAYVEIVDARHALRRQDWDRTRRLLDSAAQQFLAIDDVSSLCEVRIAEAELLLARQQPAAARELLLATIDEALSVEDTRSAHQCRQLLNTFTT
ncbi:AfsR/SARP family transcriptional regulator [Kribbella ginsengisoli]|uniref:BTAD domain-containing putative transcriptional regulator n=1 Tax=Kribbella ginsengisoli TaxID=363865 RepID=A0ABP6Z883_9ACTN